MRVFLDTNVLFSAFATRGLCADLVEVVLLEHELITGGAVLRELRSALRGKARLPASRCDEIARFVQQIAATCVRSSSPVSARVDPDDAVVLGEAVAGRSHVFVTGDTAVQRLTAIAGMRIQSPRDFWDLLRSQVK